MSRLGALLLCAPIAAGAATLRIGNGAEPETLDPQRMQTPHAINIAHDLYEGLTSVAPDGEIVGGAASDWDVGDGGKVYTFHLRPKLRWSNGDALTADDFVAGLRRGVDPATGGVYAAVLAPIVNADAILSGGAAPDKLGVDAPDARTLRIRLKGPTPYLPGLLTLPVAFPVHQPTLAKYGAQFAREGRLVSNGPYALDQWVVQSRIRLKRSATYWNDAATRIDTVEYFPTEDRSAELKRYRAGELDVTYNIPRTQVQWLRNDFDAELHLATLLDTYYVGFNCTRPPFADQPGLRRALAMVIDRGIIATKALRGLGRPAAGWVPDAVRDHDPQAPAWASMPMEQRIAQARTLYAQGGYGEDHPLQIELRHTLDPNDKRIATVIAAMWKQTLGVEVTLVAQEPKVFASALKLRNVTQAFLWDWIGDYDDPSTYTDVLKSDRGQNYEGWREPRYDALLDQAGLEPDRKRRQSLLQQAETLLLDDAPLTPIYFNVSSHLVKPYVGGWKDNVLDYHYTKDLQVREHR
ncbi:MAG TPA: peptide ABC transporter substrate-binding protein [Nevskiaceae bacterium]|nr:peptide ABC transporter substrate-binding protein [Nevskiaceae bacterium]